MSTMVLETDDENTELAVNVYGLNLIQRETGGVKARYMYNGHADVAVLLGANDTILASYYYDAFGNITESTGTYDNPYRYSGYRYDEETKNYYIVARYYNPAIARFLQEDTYQGDLNDPLSLNLYTYCANNPIVYKDPSGHRHMTEGTSGKYGLKEFYQDQIAKNQAEAAKYEKKAERLETGLEIMNNSLMGIPVRQSKMTQDPSLYNIADNLTLGLVSDVDRTMHTKLGTWENLVASGAAALKVFFLYSIVESAISTAAGNTLNWKSYKGNIKKAAQAVDDVADDTARAVDDVADDASRAMNEGAGGKLKANDIQFSDKFSKPAYKNQVAERGWTNESIADTINNPVKTGTSVNKYTGNSVTTYYIDDVHYIAIDNLT